jgi:hypothetical protein
MHQLKRGLIIFNSESPSRNYLFIYACTEVRESVAELPFITIISN